MSAPAAGHGLLLPVQAERLLVRVTQSTSRMVLTMDRTTASTSTRSTIISSINVCESIAPRIHLRTTLPLNSIACDVTSIRLLSSLKNWKAFPASFRSGLRCTVGDWQSNTPSHFAKAKKGSPNIQLASGMSTRRSGKTCQNYRRSEKQWIPVHKAFAERLFERTRAVVSRNLEREEPALNRRELRLLDFVPQQASRRETSSRTADILATFLGVTLVLVGTSQ